MFNPRPKSGPSPKKEKKPLKRTRIKYKRKDTGQIDTFTEIASEREWRDFITGEPLQALSTINFAHVLSKAMNRYYKFKTYKKNIVLLDEPQHAAWDKEPRSKIINDPKWRKMFELEAELKLEYKNLTKSAIE